MKIYLIRHGETDWNDMDLIQGKIDNPLNDVGLNQAQQISSFFNIIHPTALYSSSLIRAYKTMEVIKQNNDWKLDININDNFIERDFGIFEGQLAHIYKQCDNIYDAEGFESDEHLEGRIREGINQIIHNNHSINVVTCHSHVLKGLLITYFNETHKDYISFSLPNCCVVELEIIGSQINLIKVHK